MVQISHTFLAHPDYVEAFEKLGLTSIDAVFAFSAGRNLAKASLAAFRTRLQFTLQTNMSPTPVTAFLKRYDSPPIGVQVKNWLARHSLKGLAIADAQIAEKLRAAGINTPKTIACGRQRGLFFEKRSFIITEKIPAADSLEKKLPRYFLQPADRQNLRLRRDFIIRLAKFIKQFHDTGHRHRDLYLCHIFYDSTGRFHLIDLARVFRPILTPERFRCKDIAQLFYSAPRSHFAKTDRLRFYFAYTAHRRLTTYDKAFIRKIIGKAERIAHHDRKRGRCIPYEN
jgi:hypothetical protein